MRGFKDHRKLMMVGFRLNRSQCSFGGHGFRFGSPRVECESWTRKFSVLANPWRQLTGPVGLCQGRTEIQASLGQLWRLAGGRLRGVCIVTKEQRQGTKGQGNTVS